MFSGRISGYVLGHDMIQGEKVWKVRVKQDGHELYGKKFIVASTHNDITLAQGMNVSFVLGSFQEKGKNIEKAVDVAPSIVHNRKEKEKTNDNNNRND